MDKLEKLVNKLRTYTTEEDWLEFKDSWYDETGIGEYISSMSNAAAMRGMENAYLIWGISNETHEFTNTSFSFHKEVKGEPLEHYLARKVTPDIGFSFHEVEVDGKRLVVLKIPAANKVPTAFDGVRYLRIGSSKVNLNKYPERESQLFYILRVGFPNASNTEAKFHHVKQEMDFSQENLCLLTKAFLICYCNCILASEQGVVCLKSPRCMEEKHTSLEKILL